jgi:2-dehydropantoate 2-reductase
MEEVVAGARACGADLGPDDITAMVQMTESMVPYRTSMALDRVAGRPMEHDAIHGAAVRAAAAEGVAMPRVEALWRALDLLDRR